MADETPPIEPTVPAGPEKELSPTCVKVLVAAFISDLGDQNKKPATIEHYTKRLAPFAKRFSLREISTLTKLEIKEHIRLENTFQPPHKKAGQLKAAATRSSNAMVLELFEAFLIEMQVVPGKFLPRLEKPISPRRDVVPTVEEVKQMISAAAPAARLIIKALNQCGARPSEMTGAKISDWHKADGEIVLADHKTVTKTGESRIIGVGKVLCKTLTKAVGDRTDPDAPLFVNTHGEPWTVDSLAKYVNRLRKRLGLREGVVPYGLRHKFLTKLCEKTSLEDAADQANHGSLETTRQYIHKDRKLRAANQDLANDDQEEDDDEEFPVAA